VQSLRYYLTSWLEKHLPSVASNSIDDFAAIWDDVFEKLIAGGEAFTASGLGETRQGGEIARRSRKTIDHAINAPVGHLVDCLFASIKKENWKKGEKLPIHVSSRLERALTAPGEGAYHAASLIGRRLNWLNYIDEIWIESVVLPHINARDDLAEAFWNGIFSSSELPRPGQFFAKLKAEFLALFSINIRWLADSNIEDSAGQSLAVAASWGRTARAYVQPIEFRAALRHSTSSVRRSALWMAGQLVESKGWRKFGRPFIEEMWPQENQLQTPETTDGLVRVAEAAGDDFPTAVGAILPFLRPVEYPDMFIFRERRPRGGTEGEPLSKRWPQASLLVADKIIAEQLRSVPYELQQFLQDIAEADPSLQGSRAWRRLDRLVNG
jgi:hypothetical protein